MPEDSLYYHFHVFGCTNRRPEGHPAGCCASKGSEHLMTYMKRKAKELNIGKADSGTTGRINQSGCLGRCDLGPCLVIYPEGVWYAPKNEADIDEILTVHLQNGGRVERLMIPADAVAVARSAEQSRPDQKAS